MTLKRPLTGNTGKAVDDDDWAKQSMVHCAHCDEQLPISAIPYGFRPGALPREMAERFVPLERDVESTDFLREAFATSCLKHFLKGSLAGLLRRWMSLSLTDANAVVGRADMFVLSSDHAAKLLGPGRPGGLLLDVGAGSGCVTARLASLFDSVIAVESSGPMVRRLRKRGFAAHHGHDLAGLEGTAARCGIKMGSMGTVDCVALLNVLDRCEKPLSLLHELRSQLRPASGRLLLAVVLPFRPFVERGNGKVAPAERLPLPRNGDWEESAALLWETVLRPAGFKLEAVARVPYICQGDNRNAAYVLDDAIFVLSRAVTESHGGAADEQKTQPRAT
eukprot:TRINITY_DN30708_c0_g1_i1.p1 TRINITY_DN30708_c0_g1~~TRINITY_DN30708_c0_g1_i1.p1  ORF type:complete len:335 (-),score=37.93 TRINITY_DN30708_c0_g1_i1:16-1020(-)